MLRTLLTFSMLRYLTADYKSIFLRNPKFFEVIFRKYFICIVFFLQIINSSSVCLILVNSSQYICRARFASRLEHLTVSPRISIIIVQEKKYNKLNLFVVFFYKFCPNLLNGGIDEDRAPAKRSLLRWSCPLPSVFSVFVMPLIYASSSTCDVFVFHNIPFHPFQNLFP